MILQRFPVVLHQVERVLVSQRHEVQVLLLAQLIPLVEDVIAHLTVPVETRYVEGNLIMFLTAFSCTK